MTDLTRREALTRASSAALLPPLLKLPLLGGSSGGQAPPGFPTGIPLKRADYANWSREIIVDDLWTATPRTPQDICVLADWARGAGWTLRPRGRMHNWSPLAVTPGTTAAAKTVLVDTTASLHDIEVIGSEVRAQTGATLEAILTTLEAHGLGLTHTPAIGQITIGGALAIDGHGAAIPAVGEVSNSSFGSLSNLVTSLTAVVWDPSSNHYVLRTFDRSDDDAAALITSLGRAFLTEVRLRARPNVNLRCVSNVDITATELFAPAGSGGRTFSSILDATGRAEAIWYPFTDKPWMKTWSIAPGRPSSSRAVSSPYNYPFSDSLPLPVSQLANEVVTTLPLLTPAFGTAMGGVTAGGLLATLGQDLWGPSKNLLLYIRASTLRVGALSHAIHCRRQDVQWLLNRYVAYYRQSIADHAAHGRFPSNMPLEVRVTGVEHAEDSGVAGARTPLLSAMSPIAGRPELDCAVYMSSLMLPGTRGSGGFCRDLEGWMLQTFDGDRAVVRPEWSKGWAYASDGRAWSDTARLEGYRATFGADWDTAAATLDRLDPHRVFTDPFVTTLIHRGV